jgi:cysteine desulfurase
MFAVVSSCVDFPGSGAEWQAARANMTSMATSIYLDNSATTFVRPEVAEAMHPYLHEGGGNPSSLHKSGRSARAAVDEARSQVARLLNCSAEEVFFSPCATYSNNLAIIGRAKVVETHGGGKHLITSEIEHPSCLGPAKHLESLGWQVTYLPVNRQGVVSLDVLTKHIKAETSIISLMWANNEIGCLMPVEEIATLARQKKIFFHCDAVQVPGKMAIDVGKLSVDTLSLSGHKFYAPKGIGVLYARKGSQLKPIFWGGGQEGCFFPGTESVPNIVGIGKASQLAYEELETTQANLRSMQRLIMDRLLAIDGVRITGSADISERLPGHVSLLVGGLKGETIVMQCDHKGLQISSASACHQGITQPSHVVSALGYSDEEALGSIRISCGRFNTLQECENAVGTLQSVIESLRRAEARKSGHLVQYEA